MYLDYTSVFKWRQFVPKETCGDVQRLVGYPSGGGGALRALGGPVWASECPAVRRAAPTRARAATVPAVPSEVRDPDPAMHQCGCEFVPDSYRRISRNRTLFFQCNRTVRLEIYSHRKQLKYSLERIQIVVGSNRKQDSHAELDHFVATSMTGKCQFFQVSQLNGQPFPGGFVCVSFCQRVYLASCVGPP